MTFGIRGVLDFFTTVTMLAASCGVLWFLADAKGFGRKVPPTYEVGDTFGQVEGLEFRGSASTIVLYLRSTCQFCTSSFAFYRRLADTAPNTKVAVIGVEPVEVLREYVRQGGFRADTVATVQPGTLKLSATPTVALVGPDSIVRNVWRGRLDPRSETELLALLR